MINCFFVKFIGFFMKLLRINGSMPDFMALSIADATCYKRMGKSAEEDQEK